MALTFEPRTDLAVDDIDLSDPEFWALPEEEREGAFALLRRERPISFHDERGYGPFPAGPGYWALTRHQDVLDASRQPELFCSGKGSNIGDMPEAFLEFFGSMINMDDPRHARLRRIVSKGFTPRHLAGLQESVERAGQGDRRRPHREGSGRLRHRGRRHPPAGDHLRHDGHPREPARVRLRSDEHHPRSRGPGVRVRHQRGRRRSADGRVRAEPAGHRAGRRAAGQPDRRPDLGPRERRRRRRAAWTTPSWARSSSSSSWPATRPPATPSPTACTSSR